MSEKKENKMEAVAEYLTVLYTQADFLLGVTKWEAIPMLEKAAEEMEKRQYARDCLSYKHGQSQDMKARLGMLHATIKFLKARKLHFELMKDAEKTKAEEEQFNSLMENLI
jgi:hypothetical protein